MTEQNPDPRLTESLRRGAGSFSPRPAELAEIVQRAHAIRRRRRTTAVAGVVAAVVLVAVPTAVALGPHNRVATPSDPTPTASPATGTPSSTPDPTPTGSTTQPAPGPGLADLAKGPAPLNDYAVGTTVFLGSGGTTTLPVADATSFASYHGGWLVTTTDGVRDTVTQYDSQGAVVMAHPGSGPVVSQDGTQVAWWWQDAAGGGGHVYSGLGSGMSDGQGAQATPAGATVQVVGFTTQGVVYTTDNDQGTDPRVWTTDFSGSPTQVMQLAHAAAVSQSPSVIAGEAFAQGQAALGCPAVFTFPKLTTSWTDCAGNGVSAFAPDGRHALEVEGSGASTTVVIVDIASGHPVASYTPKAPLKIAGPVVWGSDGTEVLMEVYDTGSQHWALVRLTDTDKVDRASDPVAGRPDQPPFVLAATL